MAVTDAMLFGVRHARLVIHRCYVDGDELMVRLATLVAVDRENDTIGAAESDGKSVLDWEVVAEATTDVHTELGSNRLELVVVSGADESGALELSELRGDAVVVRYMDRSVVWRGDGPLDGFEDAWLG